MIFKDSEHLAVYVYLLLNACYDKNGVISYDLGKATEIKYGEVLISVREIAKKCKIETTKVHRILKKLEECNKIETRSATGAKTGKTVVAIDNYGSFETENATEEKEKCNTKAETKDEKEKRSKREKAESKELINKKKGKKNIYGSFENVKLTDEEFEKFKSKFPFNHMKYIEDLSLYIASKGDKYKSHYATLLTWNKDKDDSNSSFDTDEFFQAALARSSEHIRKRANEHKEENATDLGW